MGAAAGRSRRIRSGRLLCRRRAACRRHSGGGRHDRAPADAVGPRSPRRRARPSRRSSRSRARSRRSRCSRASAFSATSRSGATCCHDELLEHYDAVVYAVGAQTDRRIGIPGEDLPGSWAATEFVAWYNGHPDFQELEFDLSGERAVVIGNGNVAVDVARMLALTPEELAATDTTDAAIDAFNGAGIQEIVMVGRRGPAQAAFTTPELLELGELAGADVIVDPADLEGAEPTDTNSRAQPRGAARVRRARAEGKPKRLVLRFFRSPVAILRRRAGRGRRARAERARRGRRAPSPTEDKELLECGHRLSQRRLPRRRAARRAVRRVAPARSRTSAAASGRASTSPAGSSAARAASSARTRRTRPRRSSCCSRICAMPRARARRAEEIEALLVERGVRLVLYRGLDDDRRARACRGREARPPAREALHLGRAAGRRREASPPLHSNHEQDGAATGALGRRDGEGGRELPRLRRADPARRSRAGSAASRAPPRA